MVLFWKAAAAALITVILGLALGKQSQDISLMLTMAASTMLCVLALTFLEPVLEFLWELEELCGLQEDMLVILLKAAGIGLVTQIAALICTDSGNASLGKTLNILGTGVILYLSLPILRSMLELIRKILGEL